MAQIILGDALAARCSLITEGSKRKIPSKGSLQVSPGETLRVETCGGGGYGIVRERDAERRFVMCTRERSAGNARGSAMGRRSIPRPGRSNRSNPNGCAGSWKREKENNELGLSIWVDVGGTFTDAVLISEETGEIHIAKVPSTPRDPSLGFLAALNQILGKAGRHTENISYLVHGSAVATNALIEGKSPKTAFITTEGFRDLLEIGRQIRPSLYDIHFEKLKPLVPRDLCFEVPERLDATGKVLLELDESRLNEIAERIETESIRSVAICFLHSYVNAAHEDRAEQLMREHAPGAVLSVSSRICPEFREYFRASTTVVNACVKPVVAHYLEGIETQLKKEGIKAKLLIMQSNGGVLTFEQAAEMPVFMVEWGPARRGHRCQHHCRQSGFHGCGVV